MSKKIVMNIPDELTNWRHHIPVQLRFNDIDILGHLNNTVYFSLYDLGKALYFKAAYGGADHNWQRVDCVIANVNCSYVCQIKFGEEIEVFTRCVHIGEKSFTLEQVLANVQTGEIKSRCLTVMVCIDPDKRVTVPVDEGRRKGFAAYENNERLLDPDAPRP